jgi:hydroxypyruvate reductase
MDQQIQEVISIFEVAVAAVQPKQFMRTCLQADAVFGEPFTAPRIYVLGAGKAAASMAKEAEDILGDRITQGFVVTHQPTPFHLKKITAIVGGHPVPDLNSLIATTTMLEVAKGIHADDIVIFLLSGGASALLADVPHGASMEEVQMLFDSLLKSGADIKETNTVRKHLSAIKGGQLAQKLSPAKIYTIILSDVPGDDPAVIGSGPTIPDPSTFAEAWAVLEKYQISSGLRDHIKQGMEGLIPETPVVLDNSFYTIAASNRTALEAASKKAQEMGFHTQILPELVTGEAREAGIRLAQLAIDYKGPFPACILAGGETTVQVKGSGRGGRNQELALAAGIQLKDAPHITFLSAGTDGIDGPTDAAGAVVSADIMQHAPDPAEFLDNNDAWHFFESAGSLIKTGHTHTNVMDVIVILLRKPIEF